MMVCRKESVLEFADKKSSFKEMLNEAVYRIHPVATQPTVAGRDTLRGCLASCRANLSRKTPAVPSRPGSGWGLGPSLTLKEVIHPQLQKFPAAVSCDPVVPCHCVSTALRPRFVFSHG